MNPLISILVTWLVTAVSLFIISKLPLGVEIDGFKKALISAAVFGVLNALLAPVLQVIFFVPNLLTFFLLSFIFMAVINAIVFGLAAKLVRGFRLRNGIWSALFGAIALGLINSLIFRIFASLGR